MSEIRLSNTSLCTDVSGESQTQGTAVISWICHGGANQQWLPTLAGARYAFINQNSNQCLDVSGASMAAGAPVIQWPCWGGANQSFSLRPQRSGYAIVAAHSGLCLASVSTTTQGPQIQQQVCNASAQQTWQVDAHEWSMGGQNLSNSRSQDLQTALSATNAPQLALKWSHAMHGDVSATPAVVQHAVYVPDWGGYLTKFDARTGVILWQRRIDSYAGEPSGAISRTSPAVADGVLYIGDLADAHLLAIDARTGNLLWSQVINPGPFAVITQSPVVYGGVVYVGASSTEETHAAFTQGYACCRFQGSFTAVDAKTGTIKWSTKTVPDNHGVAGGYSGGGVWSSTPALDVRSRTIFITTGNNYAIPASALACQQGGGTPAQCLNPGDHIDAILALDMDTGLVKWATGVQGFDDWTFACKGLPGSVAANCPPSHGQDFDFGAGANLLRIRNADGTERLMVGAGQKSGTYWMLDASDGKILWATKVTPGSILGGILWGTATDGERVYIESSNNDGIPYTVGGAQVTAGSFAALDVTTGRILWQRVDPSTNPSRLDTAAVSVTNGVMFAGSISGHMYALDAASGQLLWDYSGAGSSSSGPAIDGDGTVYWGNGYSNYGSAAGMMFYAFSVSGR